MSDIKGSILHGQLVDKDFREIIPYTQQVENFDANGTPPSLGNPNTEINPIDGNAVEVKTFAYNQLDDAKLEIFVSNLSFTSFRLPQELVSLTSYFSTSKGIGAGLNTPHAASSGTSWSVGVSASNQASSSLDYIPDLQPIRKTYDSSNVPCLECYFFTSGSTTLASVLALLTAKLGATVLAWPNFKPVGHSFTLKGQSTSLSSTAKVQLAGSSSPSSTSISDDSGYDYSIQTRSVIRSLDLPEYLHGVIDISDYTRSDTVTVTASASLTGSGSISGTVTGGTSVPAQTVTAVISPHHLDATSPASVPHTGLYLQNITPQFNEGDLFLQRAIVVDFAYFA